MASALLDFSAEELLDFAHTVTRRVKGATLDEAEEAVSTALLEWYEKGDDLDLDPTRSPNGALVQRATWRLQTARKRDSRSLSLDAAGEASEDHAPTEFAVDEVDFEAHGQLREARDNVILRRRLEASEVGAPELRRRGAAATTRGQVFSDEKVAEVRQLRREGLIYREISAATGVPESTCVRWCLGQFRQAPTSNPGWTRELVIEAIVAVIAEDGLHPPSTQMGHDPRLPTAKCFYPLFKSWPEAVQLAVEHASKSSAPPPPLICV